MTKQTVDLVLGAFEGQIENGMIKVPAGVTATAEVDVPEGPTPEPQPQPTPGFDWHPDYAVFDESELQTVEPRIYQDEEDILVEGLHVIGDPSSERKCFVFRRCKRVIVRNCWAERGHYSGFEFVDCEDVLVEGVKATNNGRNVGSTRVGHGVVFNGECRGPLVVANCILEDNYEDGVQSGKQLHSNTVVELYHNTTARNGENDYDFKSGRVHVEGCRGRATGTRQVGMECVICHDNFAGGVFKNCDFQLPVGEENASAINLASTVGAHVEVHGGVYDASRCASFVLEVRKPGCSFAVKSAKLIGPQEKPVVWLEYGQGTFDGVDFETPRQGEVIKVGDSSYGADAVRDNAIPGNPTFGCTVNGV